MLEAAGHEIKISDLYAMKFDPVSDRRNFTSQKEANYFKQQTEEMYATEFNGFAPDILGEMDKIESILGMVENQFPAANYILLKQNEPTDKNVYLKLTPG